jgi:hypothetical protein
VNAYERAVAARLAEKQAEQRALSPLKVAQRFLREWCGRQGFGAALSPDAAASLVTMIEALVEAERPAPTPMMTTQRK